MAPVCISDTDLRAFLVGELPVALEQAVAGHLETCTACTARARQLEAIPDPAVRALRQALRTAAGSVAPPAEAADRGAGPPACPVVPGDEVLEELGRGGMGIVYKARQERPARLVALKVILAGSEAEPERRARFLAEADATARLQHPGIVQVYEAGEHAGLPYLALEYVAGGTLADRLRAGPLPPLEAAGLLEAVARAIAHAHRHGVVHRDLKPGNVLLAEGRDAPPDGGAAGEKGKPPAAGRSPKVTDFGLAKLERTDLTATGAILGTPSYMAPEQAGGAPREVGPPADVYALGAILYECLTGRPPFQGVNVLETLVQVRGQEPVPVRQLQAGVPRDLETITLKCLQKEPHRRYASADELADDLARLLAGRPVRARPVGPIGRGWRWGRRNPAVAALLAALA
jgi:serine/threonine protein kinase